MPPKSKSESKRGLVVTLVFMVLIMIGEGLAAYYGFADQEKLKAAAKASEAKVVAASDERDWYRFQIAILLAYVDKTPDANSPIGRELATNKANFDAGKYPTEKVAAIEGVKQELPALKALVARLNQRSPWDNAKAAPRETLDAVIKVRETEIEDVKKQRDKAELLVSTEKRARAQADANLVKAQADFNKAVEGVKEAFAKEREEYKTRLAKFEEDLKGVAANAFKADVKPLVEERDRLVKDVKTLTNRIKEKISDPTPRGKIVRVHLNSRKATIDLGRVHGLTAQTTFSVHGYQPSGRPKQRAKANIEVINVSESTSEVLVTAVFHPDPNTDLANGKRKEIDVLSRDNTDPIIAGDALINPLWNPNAKTHVAIAGIIDLTGFGAINVASLIQILEKQNIIVDAYVDPVDGSIKGRGVTRGTDYLLLGGKPAARDKDAVIDAIGASIEKMLAEAKNNGVAIMSPRRFANETGFNLPRTVSD
jgi:hypothetical protein